MNQHTRRRRKPRVKPNVYGGPTTYLRCDATFKSWERRQNRLCLRCSQAVAAEPSAETRHRLHKRGREGDEG